MTDKIFDTSSSGDLPVGKSINEFDKSMKGDSPKPKLTVSRQATSVGNKEQG